MRNIGALAMAVVISGCASMRKTLVELPATAMDTSGFSYAHTTVRMPVLRITALGPTAHFMQYHVLLPGDDLRNAYRPTTLHAGDEIIGIGELLGKSEYAQDLWNEMHNTYCAASLHYSVDVVDSETHKVKRIVECDGHTLADLHLELSTGAFEALAITGITPGGWADQHGLRVGDLLLGAIRVQTATLRHSWLLPMRRSRTETPTRNVRVENDPELRELLHAMFANLKPYQSTGGRDGIEGYATLLQFDLVRTMGNQTRMEHAVAAHERQVGLGIGLSCIPFCGTAAPVIGSVTNNSPAGQAGFHVGDLLISINGKPVSNSWAATKYIKRLNYGDAVNCRVMRDKQIIDIATTIGWVFEN